MAKMATTAIVPTFCFRTEDTALRKMDNKYLDASVIRTIGFDIHFSPSTKKQDFLKAACMTHGHKQMLSNIIQK